MTALDSGRLYRVTAPRQAHLLTEPRSKEFFKPFLARERSVSEAAQVLGCPLNTALYRVRVMLGAGLLQVVDVRRWAGRAVKVYRSVHDASFVPFSLTPYATLEERLEVQARPIFANLISGYAAALKANDLYGHILLRGENGEVWTTDRLPDVTPQGLPTLYSDVTVRLTDEEAHGIARTLREAFTRGLQSDTRAQGDTSSPTYLLMVTLLPLGEEQST